MVSGLYLLLKKGIQESVIIKNKNIMNVYQMYKANGFKFGFFIKRYTWGYTLAKVTSIEGVKEGEKIKGKSPYYGNPKVYAKFYDASLPKNCNEDTFLKIDEVSCPGTRGYSLIPLIPYRTDSSIKVQASQLSLNKEVVVKCPKCKAKQNPSILNQLITSIPSEFQEGNFICNNCGEDIKFRLRVNLSFDYQITE